MGQNQLELFNAKIKKQINDEQLNNISASELLKLIVETGEKINKDDQYSLEQFTQSFLNHLQELTPIVRRRSRSYEMIKNEESSNKGMEDRVKEETNCKQISQEKVDIIEEQISILHTVQDDVIRNITEIMSTKKPYKIRQNFRSLLLNMLSFNNFLIYVQHSSGRTQFNDFKNNYITEIIQDCEKSTLLEYIFRKYDGTINLKQNADIVELFDMESEFKENSNLFKAEVYKQNLKYKVCLLYKLKQKEIISIKSNIIDKIVSISLISSSEEQANIIQTYCKELLDILQICITESEHRFCKRVNLHSICIKDLYQDLIKSDSSAEENSELLFAKINQYQQIQYQLLERIRMYKKYICQHDKIFMDFNEEATLCFISNNFDHEVCKNLSKLWLYDKLFVEQIFKDHKNLNSFLKKAIIGKVKSNKIYQLDFQTKARVRYDSMGNILRVHVIIQQLQGSSSHSSSNIYNNSSKHILSQTEENTKQQKDLEQNRPRDHQVRQSTLIKNLEKENPGIINEGWINLFIKDNHVIRKNTHLKNKGKTYFVKRSFSHSHEKEEIGSEKGQSEAGRRLADINIESTELNMLQIDQELLQPLVLKVFRKLDFYKSDHVNKTYFDNFLSDLHNGYQIHNNPFHNFSHGVNVMHTCYLLSNTTKCKQVLNSLKIFTIIFSGLCHDVGHTGFTNLFQIASRSKKALTYNDSSPLENFHASFTFDLLRKPQNNFLIDLTDEQVKDFRKSVIANILFTDIKQHFPLLKKFNSLIKDQIPKNEEYINILSAMIVHTSDFGGSAKQFEICKSWSLKVNLQFTNQYKMEGELNLPQTPYMKDLNNVTILSKNQSGFLKVIVFPLYEAIDQFNGNEQRVKKLRQHIENNIKKWDKIYGDSITSQ